MFIYYIYTHTHNFDYNLKYLLNNGFDLPLNLSQYLPYCLLESLVYTTKGVLIEMKKGIFSQSIIIFAFQIYLALDAE